ncbi:MAG: tetratricopeptide repeat protein [Prevotellaceae bacterium]|jgi:tetratricopeptide (TPR) repeat protein|nr:tetratricopeptide repeat protein [Prevotellaceae bacterium]
MDNQFLQIIKEITDNYGIDVFNDLSITKSLLADYSEGAFYKERNLFIWILESNCHKALTTNQEIDEWKADWVKKLYEEDFINEDSVSFMLDFILDTAIAFDYFFDRGKCLLKDDNYDDAVIFFDRAINRLPSSFDAYRCKGFALLKAKNYSEAIINFKYAIKLKENGELLLAPLLYESYFNWGIHCLENNIGKEAVNHFNNAIKYITDDKKQYIELLTYLASSYENIKNYNDAIEAYSEIIKIDEKDIKAYKKRLHIYYKMCRYDEVLIDCKILLDANKSDVETIYHIALVYYKQEKYFDSKDEIEILLQMDISLELKNKIENLKTLVNMEISHFYEKSGDSYYENKNYQKAIKNYEKVLKYYTSDSILLKIGFSYFIPKNNDLALITFKKILDSYSDSVEHLIANGVIKFLKGHYEETIKHFENKNVMVSSHSEFTNPILIKAYLNHGNYLMRLGKIDEAYTLYTNANKYFPDQLEFTIGKGIAAYRKNDFYVAIDLLEKSLILKPDNSDDLCDILYDAYLNIGIQNNVNEEYREAIVNFNKVIHNIENTNQKYIIAIKNRSYSFCKMDRYDDVINDCSAILNIEDDIDTLVMRAETYMKLDNYKFALKDCNRILELETHNFKAYLNRINILVKQDYMIIAKILAEMALRNKVMQPIYKELTNVLDKINSELSLEYKEYNKSGELNLFENNYSYAIHCFLKAIFINPNDHISFVRIGYSLNQLKKQGNDSNMNNTFYYYGLIHAKESIKDVFRDEIEQAESFHITKEYNQYISSIIDNINMQLSQIKN